MILNYKRFVESINNSNILSYYSFDWDDNILFMPTKIIMDKLIGGQWVETPVSTSEFAQIRGDKTNWRLSDGDPNKAFSEFRDNGARGEGAFLLDVQEAIMSGRFGPAFEDFLECLRNGSIFSIITARGHESPILRGGVEWILDNYLKPDDLEEMYQNLKKFNYLFKSGDEYDTFLRGTPSKNELVKKYLDNCYFVGVSAPSREGSADNPEEAKKLALLEFKKGVDKLASSIGFKSMIGFSDDDKGNVKHIEDLFKNINREEFPSIIKWVVKDTSNPMSVSKKVVEHRTPGLQSSTNAHRSHSHLSNKTFNVSDTDSTFKLSMEELKRLISDVKDSGDKPSIKKFDSFQTSNLYEDIAEYVFSKLSKIKSERGELTVEFYEDWMKSFGADEDTIDAVMHELVNMGLNFDVD